MSPVSPLLHVYVIDPMPSSSASVLAAVSTSSSVAVPLIVTEPVGLSLTFATALVAELVAVSPFE